jgi:hypothetical protein
MRSMDRDNFYCMIFRNEGRVENIIMHAWISVRDEVSGSSQDRKLVGQLMDVIVLTYNIENNN